MPSKQMMDSEGFGVIPKVVSFGFSKTYTALAIGAALLAVSGAASASATPPGLEQATTRALSGTPDADRPGVAEKAVRLKAMREAAQSYGARAGLLHRTHEIRSEYEKVSKDLDVIWNFQPLMLPNTSVKTAGDLQSRDILPPVVIVEDGSFKKDSDTIIHKGGPRYRMFSQAKFVSSPPTWRNYLFSALGEDSPTPPVAALLPKTDEEKADFSKWISEGWAAGVDQADRIKTINLNRLSRDYVGIWAYYELLRDNVVSLPFVATSNPGVSGDANNLSINDVTLNITVMPQFRLDSSQWSPGVTK